MKTLEFSGLAHLEVHAATTKSGMKRGQLSASAKDETEPLLWYARRFMYPDCLACTSGELNGKPVAELTFEEYMELPDQLTEAWLAAVYEVNPHWAPQLPESNAEQEEKKASPPSSG